MRTLHVMNRMPRDSADPKTLEEWEHADGNFHKLCLPGVKCRCC